MRRWVILGVALVLGALTLGWAARAEEARRAAFHFGGGGFGPPAFGGRGEHRMGERLLAMLDNDRVKAALGLTDQQADRLRQTAVETEKFSVKTRAEMAVRRIELRELLRAEKPDREVVMKKVDEISSLRAEMMKKHVEALLVAKTVLTPEQQKKIRSFIEQRRGGEGMSQRFWWNRREGPEGPKFNTPVPPPRGPDAPPNE